MSKKALPVIIFVIAVAAAVPALAAAAPVAVVKGAAPSSAFAPSNECGCHAALMGQWSLSMHAQAITDPIYKAKRDEGNKATGGTIGAFCDTCHAPVGTVSGEVAEGRMTASSADSVGCSFCHQTVGLKPGEPGNTSHLVETDGVRRAQLMDPQAPHPAAYSEIQTKAEICGGCHNVNHPVNGMHLESTYSEWKASPYAKEGVVCQDCHMTRDASARGPYTGTAAGGAPERDNLYAMTFVGANAILGPHDDAVDRLKSAATMEMDAPEIVAEGSEASVTVTITNSGAGHYLPTGLTEVRQMWLEVFAEAPDGTRTEVGKHVFGTILKDSAGKYPVELWDAVAIQSDDRIPPKESVTKSFTFKMPSGMQRGQLKAVLNYQSVPDELAEKAGVENVTTEMVAASTAVYPSEAAKTTASENDDDSPSQVLWYVVIAAVLAALAGMFLFVRSRRA